MCCQNVFFFMNKLLIAFFLGLIGLGFLPQKPKPVFYIIGDSTVRNGDGTGSNGQWGWGSFVAAYFDTGRISVRNKLWGKAKDYLHKSLELKESPSTYAELAALLSSMGDYESSNQYYQTGLLLIADKEAKIETKQPDQSDE